MLRSGYFLSGIRLRACKKRGKKADRRPLFVEPDEKYISAVPADRRLIEWYGGGIAGAGGWYRYATGYNWWFIRNILLFYLLFFAVYRLADRPWVRMTLMAAATAGYSVWLVSQGRASFWYISNLAFVAGMILAQYERQLLRARPFCIRCSFLCWLPEWHGRSKPGWM